MVSSGIELATFRLVVQCLYQLLCRVISVTVHNLNSSLPLSKHELQRDIDVVAGKKTDLDEIQQSCGD